VQFLAEKSIRSTSKKQQNGIANFAASVLSVQAVVAGAQLLKHDFLIAICSIKLLGRPTFFQLVSN
jgi:hypothetical protein